MKHETISYICDNCGSEYAEDQVTKVTLTIGKSSYTPDICNILCLPKLVELGQRSKGATPSLSSTYCAECNRSFASPAGLSLHKTRVHKG